MSPCQFSFPGFGAALAQNLLRVEVVSSLEKLSPLAEDWNALAARAPQKLPMLSHAWIASYLEHQLEPGEMWFCLFAFEGGKLVGVLPLLASQHSLLWLSNLKLRTPYNVHTFGVEPLAERGYEDEVRRLFWEILDRLYPSGFLLECRRVPQSSPSLLARNGETEDTIVFLDVSGTGCFLKVAGSFEDYLARIPARFKRNLRRLGRKVEDLGEVTAHFHTGDATRAEHLEAFMRVETSGWKGRVGTAIATDPRHTAFFRALTRRLTELGWLEWHFLCVDGKEIATHLAVRMDRTLTLYKIAYDEAYSSCSPGNILFEKMIRHAFGSGLVDEINFLSDEPWMKNWGLSRRSYYDLQMHYKRPLPLFLPFMSTKARWAYRWMKRQSLIPEAQGPAKRADVKDPVE
jgi:CelD/BcsL family acetyltransferase involved in cellulose biosynthesis